MIECAVTTLCVIFAVVIVIVNNHLQYKLKKQIRKDNKDMKKDVRKYLSGLDK